MAEEGKDGVRLVVWAPSFTPSTSRLPTLDPDSLYAASILQVRRVYKRYSLGAPSSLLHSRVPCLEMETTGVSLASDVDTLQRHTRRLVEQGQKVGSGERPASLLEEDRDVVALDNEGDSSSASRPDEGNGRHRWARTRALERFLLSALHPLVYQEMFSSSQSLYSRHTAKAYQAGLPFLYRDSLISRLRRELRFHFASRAAFMESSGFFGEEKELGAILAESNSKVYLQQEEERERQRLADRSGISKNGKKGIGGLSAFRGNGMLNEEKEQAARAFSEMRLKSYAKKVLNTFSEALGSEKYLFGSERPSLLDLRLFSLLAPLLLPVSTYPALTQSTLPSLLRSDFGSLVKHTERLQAMIWPIEVQTVMETGLSAGQEVIGRQVCLLTDWPSLAGRQDVSEEASSPPMPMTIRVASSLGTFCGQMYHYTSSILSSTSKGRQGRAKDASSSTTTKETEKGKEETKVSPMTEAERQDARRVMIGRWIWISSAVIGLIGTAFASGLIAIELIDTADGGDDEDDLEEAVKAELFNKNQPSRAEQHAMEAHENEKPDVDISDDEDDDDDSATEANMDEVNDDDGEYEVVCLNDDAEDVDGEEDSLAEEVDIDEDDNDD